MSQRDLAETARTTQSVVGRIESGQVSPTIDTVLKLADAAGFDVRLELVPHRVEDPVVAVFKAGVDRSLLVANLRRGVEERLRMNDEVYRFTADLRRGLRVAEPAPKK